MRRTMMLKPLAFAATAAALLVVPDTPDADGAIFKALPVRPEVLTLPAGALSQRVTVPCAQCKDKDSQLRLDLNVEDGSRLMLNDFELYPTANPWNGDLSAVVVDAHGTEKQRRLGYSLKVEPRPEDVDLRMQVVDIELRVIEVGSYFVEGIPTVKVQLIRAQNEVAIGNVELMRPGASRCTTSWCQWLDKTMASLSKLMGKITPMGCHRRPHHGAKASQDGHAGRPHRHHRHTLGRLAKDIAMHIVLPVLVGLTTGVGLAVCVLSPPP